MLNTHGTGGLTMADFISREAAIDAIWKPEVRPNDLIFDALRRACEEEVKHIPAADVRPVVRGKWTRVDYEPCGHDYICSVCGCKCDGPWNFCPNCGADMREVTP
jgi:rubrerythrin